MKHPRPKNKTTLYSLIKLKGVSNFHKLYDVPLEEVKRIHQEIYKAEEEYASVPWPRQTMTPQEFIKRGRELLRREKDGTL